MITLLGVHLRRISRKEIMRRIEQTKGSLFIVTVNPEILLHAWRDKTYRTIINHADLRVIDGVGIVLVAKLLYGVTLERFPGADLAEEVLTLAAAKKKRVFLLGGTYISNRKAIRNVCSNFQFPISNQFPMNKFPDIKGLGGNFDEKNAMKKIVEFKPNILLVALGAPHQEKFIYSYVTSYKLQVTGVMMGIGGTIDYWAYPWLRAPVIVRRIGFEWLWRLVLQPWRLLRIFKGVIIFPLACFWERILLK